MVLVTHDAEERSYFCTFIQDTSLRLSGFFKSPFWSRIVLQAAHHHPSIMHSLAALGAITRAHPALPALRRQHDLQIVPPSQGKFALIQ